MFNMLILICYGVDINNVVVIKQCKSSVMRRRLVKKKSVICEFHMMKLHSNSVCVEIVYLPHPLLKCSSCLLYNNYLYTCFSMHMSLLSIVHVEPIQVLLFFLIILCVQTSLSAISGAVFWMLPNLLATVLPWLGQQQTQYSICVIVKHIRRMFASECICCWFLFTDILLLFLLLFLSSLIH